MSPVAVTAFLAPLIRSWVIDREYKATNDEEDALETPSISTDATVSEPVIVKVDGGNSGTSVSETENTAELRNLEPKGSTDANATGDPEIVSDQKSDLSS